MLQPKPLAILCSALAAVTFTAMWLLYSRAEVAKANAAGAPWEVPLLATALGSGLAALAGLVPAAAPLARLATLLEPLAWALALAGCSGRGPSWSELAPTGRRLILLLSATLLLLASLEPFARRLHASSRAALALAALFLLVAVLRRLDEEGFWKLKYLAAAAAALLFLHLAEAVGSSGAADAAVGPELGRALLTLAAAPLVGISLRRLDEFAPAAVGGRAVASGVLVAAVVTVYGAGVGWLSYELRVAFPSGGPGLALATAAAAILALALVLVSGTVQALLRRLVGRIFGTRFDYEREWLRVIDTVGAGDGGESLPLRVIRAVGEAVDATGGAIWLRTGRDRFELEAIRNLDRPPVSLIEAPGLADLLVRLDGPLELDRLAAVPDAPAWPDWLPRPPRGWLVLPLVHRGELSGFMVLAEPRAGRRLGVEEARLLRILAREAASYLAEDRATRALAEARQFTTFGRRFAFLTHDLKNLVAELALAAANARRHIDDPAFRADLVRTLDDAVARLRELLDRLREDARAEHREVDLVELLARARGSRPRRRPRLAAAPPSLTARTDDGRLLAALRHLIDNGFEATRELGPVELRLRAERGVAVIEVHDGGPGMPAGADGEPPFQPFVTTKPDGLGLGLVAARDLVESLGGRLEVESRPGQGTTARIVLPRFETMS